MGKIRGIFQFTGKIGDAVGMKGDDGQNYARVRVREVANPNTERQQDVRTVASLAGKISTITSYEIIKGMNGNNKRQRRSRFMQNIMTNATTVKDPITGAVQAVLKPEDLLLSEGQTMALPKMLPTLRGGILSVDHGNWPEDLAAVVVVAYGSTANDIYVKCDYKVVLPSDQTPATINMGEEVIAATVYAIPVSRAMGASKTSYASALEALEANREFAVINASKDTSALGYNRSSYIGGVEDDQQ